jgi:hypothetical protein
VSARIGWRAGGALVRTFLHLYAAIVAFTLIEAFLFVTGPVSC